MIKTKITIVILIFLQMFLCSSCFFKKEEIRHVNTRRIGKKLYIETYQVFSGDVYAGDSYVIFLTDSINFRQKLGDYDDHEWPEIKEHKGIVTIVWNDSHVFRYRKHKLEISKLQNERYDDLQDTIFVSLGYVKSHTIN